MRQEDFLRMRDYKNFHKRVLKKTLRRRKKRSADLEETSRIWKNMSQTLE